MPGVLLKLRRMIFGGNNPPPQTTEVAPVVGEYHHSVIATSENFDPHHAWDGEAERRRMRDMLKQNDAPSTTS